MAQQFAKGLVSDEKGSPIPNARIFIKNDASQRTVADLNGRYQLSLMPGEYFLVVTSPGFEDRETYISIGGIDIVKDIQLFPAKAKDLGSAGDTPAASCLPREWRSLFRAPGT